MPRYLFSVFLSSLMMISFSKAQKGLPAKKIVTMQVTTHYPQIEEFNKTLLSRLKVPAGFKVSIAASGLGKPRMMYVTSDGAMYVTRRDQNDVLLLKDTDGDGKFDDMSSVVVKFQGVHGIAVQDNYLYLISNRILKRYTMNSDHSLKDTVTIFEDLPDGGQHPNRTIHFGPDRKLYISVGSDCNDCSEDNGELATMLQVNLDSSTRKIYARGLRNTIGFDWQPSTGELWGVDNGSDMKGDNIPPEELNKITYASHYGWPLVYGKQVPDETREDPPGNTKAAFALMTQPDVMEFPAHSAPIDFTFLDMATGFPAAYMDDALVTWHGSWNRQNPSGYKVERIKFENGKPVGSEDFLSGFLSADGNSRFGRPAGLAVSNKGVVYISDDANGVIYAVSPNK